jgi:uncharacterized protein (DUF433 family)/DNA-binding transcriptional MerR regulator
MELGGAYTSDRAAALSGVPRSTLYYWARNGHLIPSVALKPRLWSYMDLLALRTIYWLRQAKRAFELDVPPTSMPKVRRALKQLRELDLDLFEQERPAIAVTLDGDVAINATALPLQKVNGQYLEPTLVDILGPFEGLEGSKGPDLLRPRATLRIIPGKISGAPHIEGTRLPTQSIFALAERGFSIGQLVRVYPFVSHDSVIDSLDLEQQLKQNAGIKRAA